MAQTPQRADLNIEEFRGLLLAERQRLTSLHNEQRADMMDESKDGSENELGSFSTFDPADNTDAGAFLADRDRDAAQDSNTVEMLKMIDAALGKIEDGSYGICEVTGKPIPVARLRALPWATMIVEAAEEFDK